MSREREELFDERGHSGDERAVAHRGAVETEQRGGDETYRCHRDHVGDLVHQQRGQPFRFGVAGGFVERRQIQPAIGQIAFQRNRRTEIDARISEAMKASSQVQVGVLHQPLRGTQGRLRFGWPPCRGRHTGKLGAIFEDPVVIDANRHEHQIAGRVASVVLRHVRKQAHLRGPQAPGLREAAFQEHGLRDPLLDRDLHVGFENFSIQRIAGSSADEEPAQRAQEVVERPDARPLADREAERHVGRREKRQQDVVHVAAMVHHENDAGVRRDTLQDRFVDVADTDAVRDASEPASQSKRQAMVEARAVLRDDFFSELTQRLAYDFERRACRPTGRLRGCSDDHPFDDCRSFRPGVRRSPRRRNRRHGHGDTGLLSVT